MSWRHEDGEPHADGCTCARCTLTRAGFDDTKPFGRARTPDMKRAIVERIYAAWLASPHERLGQLIENSLNMGQPLFYVEDETLIAQIEKRLSGKV